MKSTINRIEVLKCMARDLKAGADRSNYRGEICRSILYLIANDYDNYFDDFCVAFVEDIRCARNNSKLFDLVYLLMDPSSGSTEHYLIDILYFACYDDYYETVKYLIKQGVDVNYTSGNPRDLYNPEYLFKYIYDVGYIDIAYLLLDAGIKINCHDFVGRESECNYEKCEVISYLIQKMYNLK